MAPRASLDLEGGHVQLATRRVRVRVLDERGHVEVGGGEGPVLRPPTFGERTRLVASALGSAHPAQRLAAALVTALRSRAGICDATAERVVALLLAGAGDAGPPLVETACLVARASGSPLDSVELLPATTVDFYARRLTSDAPDDDGWHRVVLAEAAPESASAVQADDDAIVMELAEVLLDRARAWGSQELRDVAAGTGAHEAFADGSTGSTRAPGSDALPDESAVGMSGGVAPDDGSDADIARRLEPPTESSRVIPLPNASDTTSPAGAPLLRFRQALFKAAATHTQVEGTTMRDVRRVDASPSGESNALPAAPSLAHSSSGRVDWHPSEWNPGPWRLDRRERSALAVVPTDAPRAGARWPTAAPNASVTASVGTPMVAPRSADELADAMAESLRREAARRGLVP